MVVATGQNLTDIPFTDEVGVSHEEEVKDVVFSRRLRDNWSHECVLQHLEQSVALLVASHSAPIDLRTVKVPYNYRLLVLSHGLDFLVQHRVVSSLLFRRSVHCTDRQHVTLAGL